MVVGGAAGWDPPLSVGMFSPGSGSGDQRQQRAQQGVGGGAGLLQGRLHPALCVQSGQKISSHQQVIRRL